MGSMISIDHAKKVLTQIDHAVSGGARIIAGGRARTDLGPSFVKPTILTDVTDNMNISREETFGPVVTLYPVRTAEEAIRRANDSQFGLNASVGPPAGRRLVVLRGSSRWDRRVSIRRFSSTPASMCRWEE